MKRTALWLVLLAVAGVLFWLLFSGGNESHNINEDIGPEKSKGVKSKVSVPVRNAAPVATEFFDNDPIGTLSIDGQVVNEKGEPVVGAQVSISSVPVRVTTSGEQGLFSFDGLNPRNYYIIARTNSLIGEATAQPTEDGLPVIVKIKEGKTIRLIVLDAMDQHPIEGARVYIGQQTRAEAKTNKEGVVEFRAMPRWGNTAFIFAEGYALTTESFFLRKEELEQTVLMQPGVPVSGKVLDPKGNPIAGAQITSNSLSNGGISLLWLPDEISIRSDEQGNWSIPGVAAGAYVFRAMHPEYATGESPSTTVEGKIALTGVTIQLKDGATLTGTVVDESGSPVPSAQVNVSPESIKWQMRSVFSDATGVFSLKGLSPEPIYVSAKTTDQTSNPILIDLKTTHEPIQIQLTNKGTIEGFVVSTKGDPIEKAYVTASMSGSWEKNRFNPSQYLSAETDADGKFVFHGIPADTDFSVMAQRTQGAGYSSMPGQNEFKARAGDHSLRFILGGTATIKGRVAFRDGTIPTEYDININFTNSKTFRNADGSFSLEYDAVGAVALLVQGDSFMTTSKGVTLKENTEVDAGLIELDRGKTIHGIVVDESGKPVSGATVAVNPRYGEASNLSGMRFEDDKNKISGPDGRFKITAVSPSYRFLFAEHLSYGRSEPIILSESDADDTEYKLVLKATGTLEGTVTYKGTPVASGISAHYQIESFRDGGFFSKSGEDGLYRFERLRAGTYYIDAERTGGTTPNTSMGQRTTTVTIKPGETTHFDIEIPSGVTLTVTTNTANLIQWTVTLFSGNVQINKNSDIYEQANALPFEKARQCHDYVGDNVTVKPARFEATPPGSYTVCATFSIKVEPEEADTNERLPRQSKFVCSPLQITSSPEEQSINLQPK